MLALSLVASGCGIGPKKETGNNSPTAAKQSNGISPDGASGMGAGEANDASGSGKTSGGGVNSGGDKL